MSIPDKFELHLRCCVMSVVSLLKYGCCDNTDLWTILESVKMVAVKTVEVSVLPTGYLWLPDRWIFADGDKSVRHLSPDYSFLIRHSSGVNVVFDLGMRKVRA